MCQSVLPVPPPSPIPPWGVLSELALNLTKMQSSPDFEIGISLIQSPYESPLVFVPRKHLFVMRKEEVIQKFDQKSTEEDPIAK